MFIKNSLFKTLPYFLCFFINLGSTCLWAGNHFEPWKDTAVKWAIYKVLKIDTSLSNTIRDLFLGVQNNLDDFNPGFFKRKMTREWRDLVENPVDNVSLHPFSHRLHVSFSLTSLLVTVANFNIKGNIFEENRYGKYFPQFTIGWSTWWFFSPRIAERIPEAKEFIVETFKELPKIWGLSPSLVVSKSVGRNIKLFTGYKFSTGRVSIKFNQDLNLGVNDFDELLSGQELDFALTANEFIFGTAILLNSSREAVITSSFNPKERHIYVKTEVMGKVWGFGIGVYPFNFITLRPYIKLRFTY